MSEMFKYVIGALLGQLSTRAVAADTQTFQREIDVFFSTGLGHFVFLVLMLLFLLWLFLPLAVFGLKRKLNSLIRQIAESNKILAEIRNELAALSAEEPVEDYPTKARPTDEGTVSQELYDQIKFDS